MDWLKKQITLAQQGIAANTGGDNSSVESDEGSPLHNKGILIMYCHVVKGSSMRLFSQFNSV